MRTPIVGGNWKMHTNREEAHRLLEGLREEFDGASGAEVVIFPPFPWLGLAADALAGSAVQVGAQNAYWEPRGAFTGEVSPQMLQGTVQWVLVGHSERRQYFGETDEETSRRLRAVVESGMHAILAVGERREEREDGRTLDVLRRQLLTAFQGTEGPPGKLVIAYEPVWAIGTGIPATPEIAQEVCQQIRDTVRARFGEPAAQALRIQYGGSVTAENIASFVAEPDIDGALVGGASLDARQFAAICRTVSEIRGP